MYGQWFRRPSRSPTGCGGNRHTCDVTKIVVEGTLFVNGKRIGAHREGTDLPLVVDVTDA